MRAGRLKMRLVLQRATAVQDTTGHPDKTWADVVTVWGSVEPLNMKEQIQNGQVAATATHQIVIRYRSGVLPTDRWSWDSRIFNIESITNVGETNRAIYMICHEEV